VSARVSIASISLALVTRTYRHRSVPSRHTLSLPEHGHPATAWRFGSICTAPGLPSSPQELKANILTQKPHVCRRRPLPWLAT
jgi:hypothetical protein